MNSSAPRRQIPALDGIRGIAIIWVVFHNATAMPTAPSSRVLHVLPFLGHHGWIGVQLFFALSGFLITGGLLDSRGSAHYFRNFYAKRALRILPLYYTVLLVLLVLVPLVASPPPPFSSDHQAPLWLFTANWTQTLPYGFAHFWSLAIEEQFYLIWPLVVFGLAPRRLLPACLAIAAGALLLRAALLAWGVSTWTLYINTACRMDALTLGAAGACLLRIPNWREALHARPTLVGVAALVVFLLGIPVTHFYNRDSLSGATFGYSLLALSSAAFVTWTAMLQGRALTGFGVGALLNSVPLRSCGRYSYAMYVFHNLLHKLLGEPWLIGRFGELPPLPVVFLYALVLLLCTYVLAFLSYHLLEKHFLRLKRPFELHERRREV
jgi:peptidoglycan/LPS O-acetylase OafA/YrhL